MTTSRSSGVAIHVCASIATAAPGRRWPRLPSFDDTVLRAAAICQRIGIDDQRTLAAEQATRAALLQVLQDARTTLADDGLLVLTFAGHTVRGDGPPEAAHWCLFDGELEIAELAAHLAQFPARARLVIIADTCYGAAIARVLVGPQQTVVLASCGEDQTADARMASVLMVRLDRFVGAADRQGSLDELRALLEADTPDSERPSVWTNTPSWWSAPPLELAARGD